MIKRTLRLLGLPLLLLCWAILILYPAVYLLALGAGYILKGNFLYFFNHKVELQREYFGTSRELWLDHKGRNPIPKYYKLELMYPPWLSIDPLLNLWHWYWTDKPTTPRPTTF